MGLWRNPVRDNGVCLYPHVVILGAGASRAACLEGDASGKKLPLMVDFVQTLGLSDFLRSRGIAAIETNFESLYDELATTGEDGDLMSQIERHVRDYFDGMRLPSEPTIYDCLILSLREKDLIASFNWDPLLLQAYRRNVCMRRLPHLAFLHGNVAVGVCRKHRPWGCLGDACQKCGKPLKPSRLLYPVRHKDYSADPFIRGEWDALRNALRRAYFLTIFGYGAPATDVEARDLMLSQWRDNRTVDLAEVEIIDIKPRDELEKAWGEFFVRQHYSIDGDVFCSWLFRHPRRSCEMLDAGTLLLKPPVSNRFPRFRSLIALQHWVGPLIGEEDRYERDGVPFSGRPCPEPDKGEVVPEDAGDSGAG